MLSSWADARKAHPPILDGTTVGGVVKGNDTEAEYTVNQLARVLNISRTTLLYYEDVGLVTPERKDKSNYRVYRNKDVLNLMNIIMLRNIGLGTEEIAELNRNGDPLSEENISSYCDHLTERIEYLEAVRTALTNYRAERGQSDDPFAIADVPRYYYALSNCDQGWDQFNKTPVTDELLAHMPLTGIGAIYDEDIFQEGRTIRWGRFVAEDNLRFLAIDPSELLSIGGCRCLIVRVWGGASLQNDSGEMRMREALVVLEEHGYRPEGRGFSPCMQPRERFFFELYQPIVAIAH